MALQLHVQPPRKEALEMLELAPCSLETAVNKPLGDHSLGAA